MAAVSPEVPTGIFQDSTPTNYKVPLPEQLSPFGQLMMDKIKATIGLPIGQVAAHIINDFAHGPNALGEQFILHATATRPLRRHERWDRRFADLLSRELGARLLSGDSLTPNELRVYALLSHVEAAHNRHRNAPYEDPTDIPWIVPRYRSPLRELSAANPEWTGLDGEERFYMHPRRGEPYIVYL